MWFWLAAHALFVWRLVEAARHWEPEDTNVLAFAIVGTAAAFFAAVCVLVFVVLWLGVAIADWRKRAM